MPTIKRSIAACRLAGVGLLLAILAPAATARAQDHREPGHWCATCAGLLADNETAFRPVTRWSNTFTNGSGLGQGDHTTLTWSIIPDGTTIPAEISGQTTGPSDMIEAFDDLYGAGPGGSDLTQRPWFWLFENSFVRWSELAALDYVYVEDDGASFPTSSGLSGDRGDVRIGGIFITGPGSVLAYNYFPNTGDMVIDTADTAVLGNSDPNGEFRRARNIIMHEHGHGMGLAHTISSDSAILMEPFLGTSFLGPQFDDILSAQRLYGDVLEKNGGNDTPGTAYDFGTIANFSSVSIGFDAGTTAVSFDQTSFVSIDDESDLDYYRFSIDELTGIRIVLTPKGPTYLEGPQGGTETLFNTRTLSDLTLAIFGDDGTTLIRFADNTLHGGAEQINLIDMEPGDYFVLVGGLDTNRIQMYQLDVLAAPVPEPVSAGLLAASAIMLLRRRRAA